MVEEGQTDRLHPESSDIENNWGKSIFFKIRLAK